MKRRRIISMLFFNCFLIMGLAVILMNQEVTAQEVELIPGAVLEGENLTAVQLNHLESTKYIGNDESAGTPRMDDIYMTLGDERMLDIDKFINMFPEEKLSSEELLFHTYNPNVVQVDNRGMLKAVKGGGATILIRNKAGSCEATCTIHVSVDKDEWNSWTYPSNKSNSTEEKLTNKPVKPANEKSQKLLPPDDVSVYLHNATSLEVSWAKCKNADGYIIYRYNTAKKRYEKVQQVTKKKRYWIDKGLKSGKVYQYKVTAFRKKKNKIIQSKKSYAVSAVTHGKKAKVVNADDVHIRDADTGWEDIYRSGWEVEVGSTIKFEAYIEGETVKGKAKPKLVSKKTVWRSSDETIVKVDQNGNVTATEKEGTCYITVRTHNGLVGKQKIEVTNYAKPETFPEYDGLYRDVNLLLTTYKENVCNIADYFRRYGKKNIWGTIYWDNNGTIVGYPEYTNVSEIYDDVNQLLKEFPFDMEIRYSGRDVIFEMKTPGVGFRMLEYSPDSDDPFDHHRIAPHWELFVSLYA